MRRTPVLVTAALAIAALLIAAAYAAGRHARPTPHPAAVPAANPAPPSVANDDRPVTPTYPIINNTAGPVDDDQLRRVLVVEDYLRIVHGRDYTLPWPGYPASRIPQIATGQARAAADAIQPPTEADYHQARTDGGYTKTVRVVDAYLNPDNTIVMNINTADTHTITTELSITATTTPCTTNRVCITTAHTIDTE